MVLSSELWPEMLCLTNKLFCQRKLVYWACHAAQCVWVDLTVQRFAVVLQWTASVSTWWRGHHYSHSVCCRGWWNCDEKACASSRYSWDSRSLVPASDTKAHSERWEQEKESRTQCATCLLIRAHYGTSRAARRWSVEAPSTTDVHVTINSAQH